MLGAVVRNIASLIQVETIGDAYLCVSGLPKRNGNEHVKEICSMSLSFIKCLEDFRIPYLPGEKLSLRIGLHTGLRVPSKGNGVLQYFI